MKLPSILLRQLALTLLGLALAGCQTPKSVTQLSHGYQEVIHPHHALIDEPEPPRISFEYCGPDGKTTLIWPSLYGVSEVVHGDLAIFVGERGFVDEGAKVTHPRLFAVTSPDLPLDITDEVLWRWAKASGKDFAKASARFTLATPAEKDGRLELRLEFSSEHSWLGNDKDWPDKSTLQLEWRQVTEIVRAVKAKGVTQKDLRWHTSFIGEKF